MASNQKPNAINELLGDNTHAPTKKKFGPPKPTLAERKKTKPFSSTITIENDARMANYQANKPGGAKTTYILNEALKLFFDKNAEYADKAGPK